MATITGITADYIKELEKTIVTGGTVDVETGNLILHKGPRPAPGEDPVGTVNVGSMFRAFLNIAYPIGTIYFTVVANSDQAQRNPRVLLGYATSGESEDDLKKFLWRPWGEGRVPIGVGPPNITPGATVVNTDVESSSQRNIQVQNLPGHLHTITHTHASSSQSTSSDSHNHIVTAGGQDNTVAGTNAKTTRLNSLRANGWKPTGATGYVSTSYTSSDAHTHKLPNISFTGNSGTVVRDNATPTPFSVVQAGRTCYMWERYA